jgi:hypothetical protein
MTCCETASEAMDAGCGCQSGGMDWGQQGFKIREDETFMVPAPSEFAGWKTGYGPECGCGCGGSCECARNTSGAIGDEVMGTATVASTLEGDRWRRRRTLPDPADRPYATYDQPYHPYDERPMICCCVDRSKAGRASYDWLCGYDVGGGRMHRPSPDFAIDNGTFYCVADDLCNGWPGDSGRRRGCPQSVRNAGQACNALAAKADWASKNLDARSCVVQVRSAEMACDSYEAQREAARSEATDKAEFDRECPPAPHLPSCYDWCQETCTVAVLCRAFGQLGSSNALLTGMANVKHCLITKSDCKGNVTTMETFVDQAFPRIVDGGISSVAITPNQFSASELSSLTRSSQGTYVTLGGRKYWVAFVKKAKCDCMSEDPCGGDVTVAHADAYPHIYQRAAGYSVNCVHFVGYMCGHVDASWWEEAYTPGLFAAGAEESGYTIQQVEGGD